MTEPDDDFRPVMQVPVALRMCVLIAASLWSASARWWLLSAAFASCVLIVQAVVLGRSCRRRRRWQRLATEVDQLRVAAHSATGWLVLEAVVDQPCTRAGVVDRIGVEPPDLDIVLDHLVLRGWLDGRWVERAGRPSERYFPLTDAGRVGMQRTTHHDGTSDVAGA